MVNLVGCCVYPHGGWVCLSLFLTSAAALAATGYGAASCRLLSVEFVASSCFGTFFDIYGNVENVHEGDETTTTTNTTTTNSEMQNCQAAVGLYQWMQPYQDDAASTADSWDDGYCTGYQETMLDAFSNILFETARGFGVFAVLLSFVIVTWTFLLSCLQMNTCQLWLYRGCAICVTLATGLTFLMELAPLCTAQDVFDSGTAPTCKVNHGGYAMIVGCLLWFVTTVISFVWLKPGDPLHPDMMDEWDEAEKSLNAGNHPQLAVASGGGSSAAADSASDADAAGGGARRSFFSNNSNRSSKMKEEEKTPPVTPSPERASQRSPTRPPQQITTTGARSKSMIVPSTQPQQQPQHQHQQQQQRASLPQQMPTLSFDSRDVPPPVVETPPRAAWTPPKVPWGRKKSPVASPSPSPSPPANPGTGTGSSQRPKSRVTVDDISNQEEMEVYLSESNHHNQQQQQQRSFASEPGIDEDSARSTNPAFRPEPQGEI